MLKKIKIEKDTNNSHGLPPDNRLLWSLAQPLCSFHSRRGIGKKLFHPLFECFIGDVLLAPIFVISTFNTFFGLLSK